MELRGFTNWLALTRADEPAPRGRYSRVMNPGDDSTISEVSVSIGVRLLLVAMVTASAAEATSAGGRLFFCVGMLLFAWLAVDAALILWRRRVRQTD